MYADFYYLFQPLPFPVNSLRPSLKYSSASRNNLLIPNFTRRLFFKKYVNGPSAPYNPKEFKVFASGCKEVYVNYPTAFTEFCAFENMGNLFKPCNKIQETIDKIVSYYGKDSIRIHIRRTDHINSIEGSSVENFFSKVDEEITRNPKTKIFLASDYKIVEKMFVQRFGDRIIYHDCELKRNSSKGMNGAVFDLYCLARTNKIIGSRCSTYSAMASWLYNTTLEY